jgi:TRAP-type C4-dicarboxylate transport system permease small subunit
MEKLDRFTRKLVRALNYISCFLLLGMMGFIVVYIVCRGLFHYTIFASYEIVQYTCLFVICLALGGNDYQEGNVRVTVLTDAISKRWRVIPELFALLLCCISSVAITYFMFDFTLMKLASNSLSLNLLIPVWIFSMVLFISFILLSFSVIVRTIKYITKYEPRNCAEETKAAETF